MELTNDLRILIIDDDPSTCQLLKDQMLTWGLHAESATNPLKALERIRSEEFDILLVDVFMPEMSGLDLLRVVTEIRPASKSIVISSGADKETALEALRLGAFDFISKPFPPELLLYFIKKAAKVIEAEKVKSKIAEELKTSKSTLVSYKGKLDKLNKQLSETTQALSLVTKNVEQAREETENRIARKLRSEIIPVIERICRDSAMSKSGKELDVLVNHLIQDLTTGFITDAWITSALSSTELRVASMIKNGLSTDEIAEQLHIAPSTVRTHRKNIRRKLKIRNASYSLRNYLISRSRKARMGGDTRLRMP